VSRAGGSAENSYYGWQTSAHENGFIVLFPESSGYFKTWDLGGGGSSSDLSFVDDMIDWASTNYNISTSQIFTTGHSWGAYFSYYVATFRSDDIAAFGAHSGGLGGAFFLGNTPSVPTGPNPTPALNGIVLHAVDDGIVPYSNSQNLYDGLLANGHNVYDDGIGNDGIIEVNGWGPDNHRYRCNTTRHSGIFSSAWLPPCDLQSASRNSISRSISFSTRMPHCKVLPLRVFLQATVLSSLFG